MSDEQTYSEAEIPSQLEAWRLRAWELGDGVIRRTYTTDGWATTQLVVGQVAFLCEAAGHHADLEVSYGELGVKLATHSAGGITDKDFALAARIEASVLWRPAADSRLDGPMGDFVAPE